MPRQPMTVHQRPTPQRRSLQHRCCRQSATTLNAFLPFTIDGDSFATCLVRTAAVDRHNPCGSTSTNGRQPRLTAAVKQDYKSPCRFRHSALSLTRRYRQREETKLLASADGNSKAGLKSSSRPPLQQHRPPRVHRCQSLSISLVEVDE